MNALLDDEEFITFYKKNPKDFTRQRCYSFKSLFLFITSTIQSSLQRELDRFFSTWNSNELTERFVTQSSFSQARKKITPQAFKAVNQVCVEHFYAQGNYKRWQQFRLVAIDGSEIFLPKTAQTTAFFGTYTTNFMHGSVVLARASKAYDILNNISIDARLVNRQIGEHTLANQHFEYLSQGDLCLLDRGYPSFDLFRNMRAKNIHFCARVTLSSWKLAKELAASDDQKEVIASIKPGYQLRKYYQEQGIEVEPITCRFIVVALPTGEKEILVTSLLETKKYPHQVFKALYHLRWGIEEAYKKDKHRLQLENFSGKTVVAVLQDFYANILMGNLTALLSGGVEAVMEEKVQKASKYRYQVNMTTALAKVKEMLPMLFSGKNMVWLLEKLIEMFVGNRSPIRPGRRYERRMGKRRRYAKGYLPL